MLVQRELNKMKIFLFSRRFILPFLFAMAASLAYLFIKFWNLYKDDLKGKNIPFEIKTAWIQSLLGGKLLTTVFLLGLLIGIIYWSHDFLKFNNTHRSIFSATNLFILALIAVLAFWYDSYVAPKADEKARTLLLKMIYVDPEEGFKPDAYTPPPQISSMTLTELYKARDSVINGEPVYYMNRGGLRGLNRLIFKKWAYPFSLVVIYFTGIMLGISFRKTVTIVPLLIGVFVFLSLWYYGHFLLDKMYLRDRTNVWTMAFGVTFIFAIIDYFLFRVLRKYGFYVEKYEVEELILGQ